VSGHCRVTADVGPTGVASEPVTTSALYIGRVETVIGSCTLARADDATIQIRAGDPICPGDVIETAAGGRVGIRFTDGTVFNLSDRARMVMTEFAFGGDQPSARFDVTNGTFAFIAGEMAKIGRLGINTPFATIRGRSGAGGIGMLSLASLFLAAMQEVEAASNEELRMDDGAINFRETQEYKDLPYGVIELVIPATSTEPERRLLLDNPDQEIVLRKVGNSTAVNYAQLSLSDMLRNYDAQKDAWHVYSLGQSGPTAFGNGGSGGALSLPPEFQPDQPFQLGPKFGGGPQGSLDPLVSGHGAGFDPIVQPPPPPPPPPQPDTNSITANPDASTVGNVLTNDTLVGVGTLTVTNIQDSNENLAVTAGTTSANGTVIHGLFGTLTIGADGSYTYVVDTSNPAVKALGAAQSLSDAFTYTATNGLTSAQTTLTVTVVGINDVPVIGGEHTGSVTEDVAVSGSGSLTTSGTLTIADPDAGQSNFTAQGGTTGSNGFGTFTLDAAGNWTYTANNNQAAIQQLGAGQSITDSFTAVSSDGTDTQTVTITIIGTEDIPDIIVGAGDSASKTLIQGDVGLTTSGTLTVTDADLSDTVTPAVDHVVLSGTTGGLTNAAVLGMLTVLPASIAANPGDANNLAWSFNSGSQTFDFLGANDTLTLTYTVKVNDGHGGTDTQTITITIAGTEDAPTITGAVASGSVTEDTLPTMASGTINFADVDLNDTHTVSATPAASGYLGTFTPTLSNDSTGDGSGQVSWNFSVANSALQFLAQGQTLTQTYTVTVSDNHGGSVDQIVTLTIAGTEDAPTITGAVASGSVTEETLPTTASGTINFADVDLNDTHTVSATPAAGGYLGTFTPTLNNDSTDDGTGQVSWNFSVANSALQFLAQGQTLTQTYTVTVSDNHGSSVNQTVTITIAGINDVPVIGGVHTGSVTEDVAVNGSGNLTTSGALTITDLDQGQSNFAPQVATTGSNGFGIFTLDAAGNWTYTANNSQAAIQLLESGQSITDSFTGVSSDGTASQLITVTINGTNDTDPNDFDDQATGTGLVGNTYRGTSGPDTIPAINQAQLIYGGAGNDNITGGNSGTGETIYGGSGNDIINGSNGTDTLFGGSGNDTIHGGEGKDVIIGGFGADTLWGDGANDTFKFLSVLDSLPSQSDTIKDFVSGNDKIDLTSISGATIVQGLVGSANTVSAHSISWFVDNVHNETILYINTTGSANHVDMEIHLTGTNINLTGADILHHA
jgi:VCBS repeat-containing protein